MLNLVGCQTRITHPEQKRVFSLIPGLENADFLQYGSMHRNTYINAPRYLNEYLQLKDHPNFYFAGQITGAEGYTEAIGTGLWAAEQILRSIDGREPAKADPRTALGALIRHLCQADENNFQPMNFNFGLLEPLKDVKLRGKAKREYLAERALEITGSNV